MRPPRIVPVVVEQFLVKRGMTTPLQRGAVLLGFSVLGFIVAMVLGFKLAASLHPASKPLVSWLALTVVLLAAFREYLIHFLIYCWKNRDEAGFTKETTPAVFKVLGFSAAGALMLLIWPLLLVDAHVKGRAIGPRNSGELSDSGKAWMESRSAVQKLDAGTPQQITPSERSSFLRTNGVSIEEVTEVRDALNGR